MGMTSLGKEWKGIKRELDKARRAAKKEAERKAEAELRARGFHPGMISRSRDGERDEYRRPGAPEERGFRGRGGGGFRGGGGGGGYGGDRDRPSRPYGGDRDNNNDRGGYRGHHR